MNTVGVIGLGIMGQAMARNLAKAGFEVRVWNRSPDRARPLAGEGMAVADGPADLASTCEAVVVMVTGPEALQAVVDDLATADLAGKVVINSSTVSPEATAEAASTVAGAGGDYLDAPVSGTKKPAEDGTLVFLAGGEPSVLARCQPLLDAMGKQTVQCGGIGDGTCMKLTINQLLISMMHAFSESLVLAEKMGLDPERLLEALGGGALAAPMYQAKGRAILDRNFDKQFPLELVFKDLNLVLAEAGRRGVALPGTAAVRESFSAAMAMGHGDEDLCAVIKVLETLAGKATD